jgi:threonine synthase
MAAHLWRGVIEEYKSRLPINAKTPIVTLGEGGTPLVYACTLSEMLNNQVYLKVEAKIKTRKIIFNKIV